MDLPDDQSPGKRPRKELQGPRPTPLKVGKESHKIKKPPVAPPLAPPPQQQAARPPPPRQPVIIYAVSPTVIHANPSEFMTLVQRLTGPGPAPESSAAERDNTTGYGLLDTRPGGGFDQSVLPPERSDRYIRPGPSTSFSDTSSVVDLYRQDHFNSTVNDQHEDDGGGGYNAVPSSPSAAEIPSMLSPASVEFLNKWLDQ